MAKIHLIGGEKGGVGKSVFARLLIQYMIDRKLDFQGFDSDRSHGALIRFYHNYAQSVNVSLFESMDTVVEAALENEERHVVVDLAAQTAQFLDRWAGESGLAELCNESGITLCYWHVMDTSRDSVFLLDRLLETYGTDFQYMVVLNEVRGDTFEVFDKHPVKEKAIAMGARFLHLKRLHPPLMAKIDAKSASFWAAMNWKEGEDKFSILERQRVKIWLTGVFNALDDLHM